MGWNKADIRSRALSPQGLKNFEEIDWRKPKPVKYQFTVPPGVTVSQDEANALFTEANRLGRALSERETMAVIEGWRGERE